MPISVHVYHHFGTEELTGLGAMFEILEKRLMSMLSDKIATMGASVDAATRRIEDLVKQVADLQNQMSSGNVSAEDQAALDALQQRLDALAAPTTTPVTPTPAPGEPTTPPTPAPGEPTPTPPTMPPGVAPPPIETTPPTTPPTP